MIINKIKYFNTVVVFLILIAFSMLSCSKEKQELRERLKFNDSWRFIIDDSEDFSNPDYDDLGWRELNLPHDWSIEGKFNKENPSGVGGGALPGGIGWYRKTFFIPLEDSVKRIYITFDGVYHNSEVFINGNLLGKRPNGYIGFQYDITDYLEFGEGSNVIAVRVDNSDQPNSRWYSGSGIYRNVWMEKNNPVHISLWGTHIVTGDITKEKAELVVSTIINNTTPIEKNLRLKTRILDVENNIVAESENIILAKPNDSTSVDQFFIVNSPRLWSIDNPYLYKAMNLIYSNDELIDNYTTTFGIRYFDFDSKKGFSLNGENLKILGVCNHHDLGALGAAINTRAIERQLEILKDMGCNAIRTAHNPPAPELLDLCDGMGFIVMNETFDVWAKKKVDYDYSTVWDDWHERDLTDHLLRDRNHPSVIMWSIGNEILEQWDSTGTKIAAELTDIVKNYAPGIQVTSGLNDPVPSNFIIKSGKLDLIGYNYQHLTFDSFPETFPDQKFIATETTSSLNSRGEYDMPSDSVRIWPVRWDIPFYDGNVNNTCSSYDNCRTPWGSTHEDSWRLIKQNEFLSGFFIWTGFDYIGEPTPYQWPSRSSYFGIIDLAGFPKDAYYMYQSEWTNDPVLHIFPHWNWTKGQQIDIWAYTNFEKVELFVNNESQGVKSKHGDQLHLQWNVIYEPGTLKAIGTNSDGSTKEVVIETAGKPAKINMVADRNQILADGSDLSFVTVTIQDMNGNLVPTADNMIHFEVDDNVTIAGVDNGNQICHESFKTNSKSAFNGKCMLIIKSKNNKRGISHIKAKSGDLQPGSLDIIIE
jgi:beta-galactosidase